MPYPRFWGLIYIFTNVRIHLSLWSAVWISSFAKKCSPMDCTKTSTSKWLQQSACSGVWCGWTGEWRAPIIPALFGLSSSLPRTRIHTHEHRDTHTNTYTHCLVSSLPRTRIHTQIHSVYYTHTRMNAETCTQTHTHFCFQLVESLFSFVNS